MRRLGTILPVLDGLPQQHMRRNNHTGRMLFRRKPIIIKATVRNLISDMSSHLLHQQNMDKAHDLGPHRMATMALRISSRLIQLKELCHLQTQIRRIFTRCSELPMSQVQVR